MTNNNSNTNPPAAKESLMSKIGGGFSWWIGSLTGKPMPRKQAPAAAPQPAPSAPPAVKASSGTGKPTPTEIRELGEDSVAQDLEKLRGLVKKISGDVTKTVGPVVTKGVETSTQKATSIGRSNKKFLSLVMKIFFIVLLIIVLAFVGMKFLKQAPKPAGNEPKPESTATTTPTSEIVISKPPSVYANDPDIIKLEKEINLLVREISGTNIKENDLNPPVLDYSINFK